MRGQPEELLTLEEAAARLGISRPTLYDWLGRSRRNLLELRGRLVNIESFQTGAKGQGRIQIAVAEIERIRSLLRVTPLPLLARRAPRPRQEVYPHINVPLGRPE